MSDLRITGKYLGATEIKSFGTNGFKTRDFWVDIPTNNEYDNTPPSLFMPKAAARIWLEITDIRVERLQGITEEDAKAEGVDTCFDKSSKYYDEYDYKNYTWHGAGGDDSFSGYSNTANAKESFHSLWLKIKGPDSWYQNPWVWAISFKVLSTTGRPEHCSLITDNCK